MHGGLDALRAESQAAAWIQVGIAPSSDRASRQALLASLAELVEDLLADGGLSNFFFMHKAPGLRLRFETSDGVRAETEARIYERIERWRHADMAIAVEPGRYEPETALFGGSNSMDYVHGLFTVDSLLWLRTLASLATANDTADDRWLVSLAAIRALFDGLDIEGTEDLSVWAHVRDKAGRQLSRPALTSAAYTGVAESVRAMWDRAATLLVEMRQPGRDLAADLLPVIRAEAARWRIGYFATRPATVGPRRAAAYFIVFHWNRAGMSARHQALLAESLASRDF